MIDLLLRLKNSVYEITGFNRSRYNSLKNPIFILLGIILFCCLLLSYSNHFSNGFHFDDNHTIENNNAIKEVTPLKFFKDGTTFSSLSTNQSYRPYTTLENAIDYKLANGLNPQIFHIHIFITFILCCFFIFLFTKKLLDNIEFSNYNQFWGLFVAAAFGLLCANAETVNYIIQRAEIVSGLYVLIGLTVFLAGGTWRKWHLYLLFPFIGFFAKEMAFVFAPILLLYFLIFEEKVYLLHFYKPDEFKKCLRSFRKALPAFIFTVAFYVFYTKMLPNTFSPGGLDNFKYLITQPMVMCHYILTYFIPYNLSADTDWTVYESILDYRAILGIIGVLSLFYLALKASKNKETRLFSFGILWFFITLLPTSSFIAFAEVLNDHRCFIPYMGLTISFIFGTHYLLNTYLPNFINQKRGQSVLLILILSFLSVNAYGIYQRNKVWKDELSLWKDVSIKSPKNGRGLMNYGLALMAEGNYAEAEIYYNKALELTPNYSNIHINLGILKNAIGEKSTAEDYFKKAIDLRSEYHPAWYYYGKFLSQEQRYDEAINCFKKVLELSPNYNNTAELLMEIYHQNEDWDKIISLSNDLLKNYSQDLIAQKYLEIAKNKKTFLEVLEEDIARSPSPEKYLNLSLKYFNKTNYEGCIRAAEKALALKPEFPEAYNNIGIANFYLKKYDKAISAYNRALELKPDYQLAKNNLREAQAQESTKNTIPSYTEQSNHYINESLRYYKERNYLACIQAARKSNEILPNAIAYNNICTAYNMLNQYDKAIEACNMALKLDSNHKLAKGNLNYALEKKLELE